MYGGANIEILRERNHLPQRIVKRDHLSVVAGPARRHVSPAAAAVLFGSMLSGHDRRYEATERDGPCRHYAWRHTKLARRHIILPPQSTVACRHVIMPPQSTEA
jgi:hypothetical protein